MGRQPPPNDTIYCSPPPVFTGIQREAGAHGLIYLLHHPERSTCWLGQTVPTLTKALNEKCYYQLHNSSFYRIIRGETTSTHHKGWQVLTSKLEDLDEINRVIQTKQHLVVVCQNPDGWSFD